MGKILKAQSSVTLDNNALSHKDLPQRVQGKQIYIPDTVFFELFSKGDWQKSITHCLAPLAPFADQVVTAIDLGGALFLELSEGHPLTSIDGDARVNSQIGLILRGCRDHPEGAVDYFRQSQPVAVAELASRTQDLDAYRALGEAVTADFKEKLTNKEREQCRADPTLVAGHLARWDAKTDLIKNLKMISTVRPDTSPNWDGDRMGNTSSCWSRMLIADACLGIRRTVQTKNPPADVVLSDRNDMQIVVIGSYTDELYTNDRGALWLDAALRHCLTVLF